MPEGVLGLMRDPATGRLVHWSALIVYGPIRCPLCRICATYPPNPRRCITGGPFDA